MKYLRLSFLFAALLVSICRADENQSSKVYKLSKGLTIQVPTNVKVFCKSPVEDFVLFTFKRGTNIVLNAYLGNQPSFPFEKGTSVKKEKINNIPIENIEHEVKSGLHSREVLFHLGDSPKWPQRLHCWYSGLTGDEAVQADKMLSTVQADGSHAQPKLGAK
ncbi:MAG: hypothetical protein JWR26_1379 [Pedosphaera sp.]|nr:hypothetical protein [Pedosphaera sp.]